MKNSEIYFETLAGALNSAEQAAHNRGLSIRSGQPNFPAVNYGKTERTSFELTDMQTGVQSKKMLHLQIYRMDSGSYELTWYIQ